MEHKPEDVRLKHENITLYIKDPINTGPGFWLARRIDSAAYAVTLVKELYDLVNTYGSITLERPDHETD